MAEAGGQAGQPSQAGPTPASPKTRKDFREVIDIVNVEVEKAK
jgi:hypothetical protein